MKYLLTALIAFTCLFSNAQTDSEKICGVWKLDQSAYNGKFSDSTMNLKKRYKLFTPTHFTVVDVNPKTNITNTNIFGTYMLENGVYKENLLNVTGDSAYMIGKKFSFTIRFEGDNILLQVGSFNGMETQEKWVRVVDGIDE